MSKRRMFSQDIVESDAFLDMPLSTQGLYFHLCMYADDYGFVSPKRIMRMIGANDDDLKVLLMKRFVLGFDSGVVVIKAWQISNTVRKDRSHETTYQEEFKTLTFNEFGAYTELKNIAKTANEIALIDSTLKKAVVNNISDDVEILTTNNTKSKVLATSRHQNGNQMATEIRLDKIRLDNTSTNVLVNSDEPTSRKITYKNLFTEIVKELGFSEKVQLTDGRLRKLKLRLAHIRDPQLLIQAAKAIRDNAYMQGDNPSGKRYGTIDYFLRSDENILKYIEDEELMTTGNLEEALKNGKYL